MSRNTDYTGRVIIELSPPMGCDPELFFTKKGGGVIGAEKVIPKEGLKLNEASKFVIDGIQVELNPAPDLCRARLSNRMQKCFQTLRTHLATMKDIEVSFSTVVEVPKAEFDSLSDDSKRLGCAPSLNAHDDKASISAKAADSPIRAAGGHIHMGLTGYTALMANRSAYIPVLDVLLGNTCVLIDRDPLAAERRKTYGRAGEYRLPSHGVEYRTLSNFWLRAYPLMSFVMAVARQSAQLVFTERYNQIYPSSLGFTSAGWPAASDLLSRVNMKTVTKAINTNNADLAWETFEIVKAWLANHSIEPVGLHPTFIPAFEFFAKQIQAKGIESWFPQDPLTHWCEKGDGHHCGWETFARGTIQTAMNKAQMAAVLAKARPASESPTPSPTSSYELPF